MQDGSPDENGRAIPGLARHTLKEGSLTKGQFAASRITASGGMTNCTTTHPYGMDFLAVPYRPERMAVAHPQ